MSQALRSRTVSDSSSVLISVGGSWGASHEHELRLHLSHPETLQPLGYAVPGKGEYVLSEKPYDVLALPRDDAADDTDSISVLLRAPNRLSLTKLDMSPRPPGRLGSGRGPFDDKKRFRSPEMKSSPLGDLARSWETEYNEECTARHVWKVPLKCGTRYTRLAVSPPSSSGNILLVGCGVQGTVPGDDYAREIQLRDVRNNGKVRKSVLLPSGNPNVYSLSYNPGHNWLVAGTFVVFGIDMQTGKVCFDGRSIRKKLNPDNDELFSLCSGVLRTPFQNLTFVGAYHQFSAIDFRGSKTPVFICGRKVVNTGYIKGMACSDRYVSYLRSQGTTTLDLRMLDQPMKLTCHEKSGKTDHIGMITAVSSTRFASVVARSDLAGGTAGLTVVDVGRAPKIVSQTGWPGSGVCHATLAEGSHRQRVEESERLEFVVSSQHVRFRSIHCGATVMATDALLFV